jgi:phage tail-like protein
MDANRTRYQLLLGRDDWSRCTTEDGVPAFGAGSSASPDFSWDAARNQITLGVRVNVFHSTPGEQPVTDDQRRGAAQDRFGNFYWIDVSQQELLVSSSGTGATSHFWASADRADVTCSAQPGGFAPLTSETPAAPLVFSGLTVTEQHYLVVGVVEPAGVLVFDLFHGGGPREFLWPATVPFAPYDMAPAPGGGVWILDRFNSRLWALDRTFSVILQDQTLTPVSDEPPNVFAPADGTPASQRPAVTFPTGILLEQSSPLGTIDARAIAALPDSSVLLLESAPGQQLSQIYRFRFGQQLGQPVSLESVLDLIAPEDLSAFSLLAYDFAFIAVEQTPTSTRQNTLYTVGPNGDQSWAFAINYDADQLTIAPYTEYYPMRLFGGRGLITGNQQVFYDSQSIWVPLIVQKRPRYADQSSLLTPVFDGQTPDCVWHRLMLDASIPADTSVQVFSRAENDPADLLLQDWNAEPLPYRRGNGTELPWTKLAPSLATWELLLQQASGQYVQLKLVFSGSGKSSPRVRALRAYYPRFSYLHQYLPSVYLADATSSSFVDRFLGNMEGFFTSIEDRIATVQAVLDPLSTPSEALNWLASWFGVALDPAWSEANRRLFLQNAAQFFEARGTVPGLTMALRLALQDCTDPTIFQTGATSYFGIRIVERYSSRQLPVGLFEDSVATTGIGSQLQQTMWTPALGPDELNRRYQQALQLPVGSVYPVFLASSDPNYVPWSSFSTTSIGFVPSQPDAASDTWTTFLKSRYTGIAALNTAYRTSYTDFSQVLFPSLLPIWPQPLKDWYQFQGILLVQSSAHQFTVYLPLSSGDAQSITAQQGKLSLAQRVIDLEKPAHTTYDLQFYWAFFRVGAARLGTDSLLDAGSRALQLLQPLLLGDSYIGAGYLAREIPGDPRSRPFLKQGDFA